MTGFVFPETEHYRLDIVRDEEDREDIYGIINKQTRVIEYRDNVYPRIYTAMFDLEERYVEAEAEQAEKTRKTTLSIVEPTIQ